MIAEIKIVIWKLFHNAPKPYKYISDICVSFKFACFYDFSIHKILKKEKKKEKKVHLIFNEDQHIYSDINESQVIRDRRIDGLHMKNQIPNWFSVYKFFSQKKTKKKKFSNIEPRWCQLINIDM